MENARETVVSSAELPAFVIDAVTAVGAPARPRVEVVFDARTRLILGFRLTESRGLIPRRFGARRKA